MLGEIGVQGVVLGHSERRAYWKVIGEKYGDLLRERIFQPLGMQDTGLDTDDLILPKRARLPPRHPTTRFPA